MPQPLHFKLQVSIMKHGKRFVVYSPALDFSSSGKSLKEAQKRFSEAVDIFFEELVEHHTLDEVLQSLGWEKVKKQWEPPIMVSQKSLDFRVPMSVSL